MERRLAAILAADMVGYSRRIRADEEGTLAAFKALRASLIDPGIAKHNGRIVKLMGDGMLVEFASVVAAVRAATEIQQALAKRNANLPEEERIVFRIGINLGDVVIDGDDIQGDGVNVAARLESISEPGGICVSGSVYDQVRDRLKLPFEDMGEKNVKNIDRPIHVWQWIPEGKVPPRNQARKGHRVAKMVAAATAVVVSAGVAGLVLWPGGGLINRLTMMAPRIVVDPVQAMPSGSVIAVLPFENQSGDDGKDYFSDGVTQDIIGALGRFSNLLVMSWDAVAPYRNSVEATSLDQVRRNLDVRYIVRGSVRRDQDRVRVSVRLTDTVDGVLLWSEHFDRDLDDIFVVQDEITQAVVGTLAVKLTTLEQERAFAKPTDRLDAYDYELLGRQNLQRQTRSANVKARQMFENAIKLDPNYSTAYVGLGSTQLADAMFGWTHRPDSALARAAELAKIAVRLDPSMSSAHSVLANVYVLRKRFDLAIVEIDLAIRLNPSDAESHGHRGWVLLVSGRSGEALGSLKTALRLNPSSSQDLVSNLGWAYYLEGQYSDAITLLESSLILHPDMLVFGRVALAAAYADFDRPEDAARVASSVRRLSPFFQASKFVQMFGDSADHEHILAALRKAGLE